MVRAGYRVKIATDLGGSFEECPTTIVDYAVRDQRWCQGNLQHSRLLISEGFRPLSRMHFFSGVLAYAASPLWILMTGLAIAGTILDRFLATRSPTTDSGQPFLSMPLHQWSLILFATAMTLLLLPKVMALTALVIDPKRLRSFGSSFQLAASGLVEIVTSILLSPIMAIYHSLFVVSTLAGRKVRWNAQQRNESGVSWSEAASQFWLMTLLGLAITALLIVFAPGWLPWFVPIVAGLIFSIPIAVAMGSSKVGLALRGSGLLRVPAEMEPPSVWLTQQETVRTAEEVPVSSSLLDRFIRDPELFQLHRKITQQTAGEAHLSAHDAKAIEAAFADGGTENIPAKMRHAVLCDLGLFKALHLEAVSAGATSG